MIYYEKVVRMVDELTPEYPKEKVMKIWNKSISSKDWFSFFVSIEETEEYAILYNVYGDSGEGQGELAVLVFEQKRIFLSQNNEYPASVYLNKQADIFTEKQFKDWGIEIVEGIDVPETIDYQSLLDNY